MNKEALIALGLTDELAVKVIEGFGTMIPKSRLDEKIAQANQLQEELKGRDAQLEELKKVDSEALQATINELQEKNTNTVKEFEQKLLDTQINAALSTALHGKVHDAEIAISLIKRDALKFEDGKLAGGLDEQIASLKESKSYLFIPETVPAPEPVKPIISGAQPHLGGGQTTQEPLSIGAQFAMQQNKQTAPAVDNSVWSQ